MVSAASITNVFHPSRAKAIAALRPLGPEPMMTASYSVRRVGEIEFKLLERIPNRVEEFLHLRLHVFIHLPPAPGLRRDRRFHFHVFPRNNVSTFLRTSSVILISGGQG